MRTDELARLLHPRTDEARVAALLDCHRPPRDPERDWAGPLPANPIGLPFGLPDVSIGGIAAGLSRRLLEAGLVLTRADDPGAFGLPDLEAPAPVDESPDRETEEVEEAA